MSLAGPLVRMGPYIKFLHNLELPDDVIDNIGWSSSAKLFKIDVKPGSGDPAA